MKTHKWTIVLIIALVVLLPLYSAAFTVDFTQIAIVKTFGKAGAPIQGRTDAGLHWKWPWPVQSLIRYDGRIFIFDDTHGQILTQDKQNILVTVFCGWRIQDADLFLRSIRTAAEAEKSIRDLVRATKKDVVGKHPLSDFLNTNPKEMELPAIEAEMLSAVQDLARRDYGVEVVAVGIKTFALPEKVTEAVIKNMISERKRFADDFRGRGKSDAELIKSRAQTAADQIIEFANLLANDIRTEGDRAAAEYYKVYDKNKQFAIYLRELQFLRESLRENSVILMTSDLQRSVGFLKDGPTLPPAEDEPAAPTGKPKKDTTKD